MKTYFDKRFEKEFLLSEKLRVTILTCVFLVGTVGAAVILLFFSNDGSEELQKGAIRRIFFFQFSLFVFELLTLFYIIRSIKKNKQTIPITGQYLNVAIEICAPVVILYLLSQQYQSPGKILHSPIANVYFVFIILSTLRLNFRISLFAGMLAATGFLTLSFYLIHSSVVTGTAGNVQNDYIMSIAKAVALMASGVGAAFVAKQIRLGIDRSLKVAEEAGKVVSLFGQQVSREIVDEMLHSDGAIKSRMMHVCVMFIDIRNFTNFILDKSSAEIVKYQNAFFSIVVNVVSKHRGIVNQFLGDGCMITFGAPVPLNNPSQHAVNAAMEIQYELNREISKGKIPMTRIGIGIHTGQAATGNIGNAERQQYSITGNVVVLASRIEQLNKTYNSRMLISAEVMNSIDRRVNSELIGDVHLKGWDEPVTIYKLA